MQSKVAVVMSTYNPQDYIEDQINSIMQQEMVSVDLIIRDDGSSLKGFTKLQSYCADFPNIYLIRGKNVGFKVSFFLALSEAVNRGYEYYAYSDQDDIWKSNKLTTLLSRVTESNQSELVFSNGSVFKENQVIGSIYSKRHIFNTFLDFLYRPTYGMTFLFNDSLAEILVEGGKAPFEKYAHDGWAILVASVTGKVFYVDQKLVKYRQHTVNASGIKNDKSSVNKIFLYLLTFYQRINKWQYKISELARFFVKHIDNNRITEPLVIVLAQNSLTMRKRINLIFSSKFTTHSYFQNMAIRFLLLSGKI